MLIRKISEHVRDQNWIAVVVDLTVVVVGIFLAFQVDRLYESNRSRIEEREFLTALAEDFSATRDAFVRVRDRHADSTSSALALLAYQSGEPVNIDHDEFYRLLADVTWMRTADARRGFRTRTTAALRADARRGSYDFLISSGKISVIQDMRLRTQLSEFFARFDGVLSDMNDDLQLFWRSTFEPYVQRNLDHVALMQRVHPRDNLSLEPTYPLDQFQEVIGSGEFEGILSDKWHLSGDLINNYDSRIEEIELIEKLLRENLARLGAAR